MTGATSERKNVVGQFTCVATESWDVVKGMVLSTVGIMCGLAFNNFLDSLFQLVLPVQEKELSTPSQVITYRFLLMMFLLALLIAFSIIISLEKVPPARFNDRDCAGGGEKNTKQQPNSAVAAANIFRQQQQQHQAHAAAPQHHALLPGHHPFDGHSHRH